MAESIGVEQSDVLWTEDPFKGSTGAQRPLVVLSNDSHPFHDEQWIAVALSTTPRPGAIVLTDDDWANGTLPERSYAYPWAVLSPRIEHVDYVVGSVTAAFVERIVTEVDRYLETPER
jgi:hypothetical protein